MSRGKLHRRYQVLTTTRPPAVFGHSRWAASTACEPPRPGRAGDPSQHAVNGRSRESEAPPDCDGSSGGAVVELNAGISDRSAHTTAESIRCGQTTASWPNTNAPCCCEPTSPSTCTSTSSPACRPKRQGSSNGSSTHAPRDHRAEERDRVDQPDRFESVEDPLAPASLEEAGDGRRAGPRVGRRRASHSQARRDARRAPAPGQRAGRCDGRLWGVRHTQHDRRSIGTKSLGDDHFASGSLHPAGRGGHGERSVERLVGPVPSRDRPHGPHRRPHQGGEHQPHSQRAHRCVTCAADTEGHTRTSTTPRDAIDTFGLLARCGRDIAGGFELAADAGEPLGEPGPLRYGPGGSARCTATPDGLHRRIRLAPLHVTVPTAAPPTPNDPSAAAERRGFSSASEQSAAQAEPSRDREHDPRIPPGRGITLRRLGTGFAAETS